MRFVGIDVGAETKGFHVAVAYEDRVVRLFRTQYPEEIVARLGLPEVIAIDAPSRALIKGPETRQAERELHRAGYRIQWTRRQPPAPTWMENGARLWAGLRAAFPVATIIETFPTAAWSHLSASSLQVPMAIWSEVDRATRADSLDAIVAADVARRWSMGQATQYGQDDELAPIWV
jgi:predicted nuclease with RNAse H fold